MSVKINNAKVNPPIKSLTFHALAKIPLNAQIKPIYDVKVYSVYVWNPKFSNRYQAIKIIVRNDKTVIEAVSVDVPN